MISGNSRSLIPELKEVLLTNFKMKDLGELKCFWGIEIARLTNVLVISQRKHALEMI